MLFEGRERMKTCAKNLWFPDMYCEFVKIQLLECNNYDFQLV